MAPVAEKISWQTSILCFCIRFQVALGDSNELLDADYEASKLPDGKHSTKGLGQTEPDPKHSLTLLVCYHKSVQQENTFSCAQCYKSRNIYRRMFFNVVTLTLFVQSKHTYEIIISLSDFTRQVVLR